MSFRSSEEDSAVSLAEISGDTSSNRLQLISDRLSSSILVLLSVTLPGDSLALGVEHMVAGPGGLYLSLFFRRQGEDGLLLLLAVLSPDLPRKTCTGREWSWMKIQVKVDVSKTFSLEKKSVKLQCICWDISKAEKGQVWLVVKVALFWLSHASIKSLLFSNVLFCTE